MTTERARRGRGRPPHPDILTPREWQVLDLLREGLTNEQIALRLDVSLATAKYHVSEILSKLGLTSREEAAAWQPLPEPAVRWWRRALAWVPRRAWPLAGAAGALAALAALAWIAFGPTAGEDDKAAISQPSASPSEAPSADPTPTPIAGSTGVSQLAYIGNDFALWLVNANGTGARRITDRCPGGLVWSPLGDRIACSYFEAAVFDLEGAEIWRTDQAAASFSLVWSPDGRRIAYRAADESLHLVDLTSGSDVPLQPRALPLDWLSNDELLAGVNVEQAGLGLTYDAYLLNVQTGQAEPRPYFDDFRRFWLSPDRKKAIVLANSFTGGVGLAIYDLDTQTEAIIPGASVGAGSEGIPDSLITISQDGSRFFAANQLAQPPVIFVGQMDGTGATQLGTVPAKAPVQISTEGLVAYCASLTETPQRISIADLGTGTTTQVEGTCSGSMAWGPSSLVR